MIPSGGERATVSSRVLARSPAPFVFYQSTGTATSAGPPLETGGRFARRYRAHVIDEGVSGSGPSLKLVPLATARIE